MLREAILAAFALAAASATGVALAARDKIPEAVQPVGEPKNCVSIASIRSTKVVDERTIDFKMAGGKTYRNVLPSSCPGLKFEERFSYRTSLSQLCNVDVIRVLHDFGGKLQEGAGCGLGKFQEVKRMRIAE